MFVLGISRDHWHKRRATGGKRKPIRKKRKFELGRPAANTKVRLNFEKFSFDKMVCSRLARCVCTLFGLGVGTKSTVLLGWTREISRGAPNVSPLNFFKKIV